MGTHRADLERAGLPASNRMTVHPVFACPVCRAPLGASDAVTDPTAAPEPEDLTLCADCGAVLVFISTTTVRVATQAELDDLSADARADIGRAQAWIEQAKDR